MRIIKTQESVCYCSRCKSQIGVLPHEFHTVGPSYEDYPSDDIGKTYWICPVCKVYNWLRDSSYDDY